MGKIFYIEGEIELNNKDKFINDLRNFLQENDNVDEFDLEMEED